MDNDFDKDYTMHRMYQLLILAELIEHTAEGKVIPGDKRMAQELLHDKSLNLVKLGDALRMPDIDVFVAMLAGANIAEPIVLENIHITLRKELRHHDR